MNRRERQQAEQLDASLSQFQAGEMEPGRFRAGGQHFPDEQKALLQTALQTRQALQPAAPDPGFVRQAESRLLNQLRAPTPGSPSQVRRMPVRQLRAIPVYLGLMLVIGILSATLGVVSASASSLPGDLLYPIKTGVEDVRLALAFSPEGELSLISRFSAERAREMAALSGKGRYQDLELAAAQYSRTLEKMLSIREALQSSGDLASATALDEILGRQVETLMRVQDQVPAQAADAIQGVLDHALDKGQGRQDGGETQEPDATERRATQTVKSQERQEEKDLQTAQQLAKKYGLTVEQVLGLFHSTCEGDWKCVREVYRELEREK
jgi:hypothetical protein